VAEFLKFQRSFSGEATIVTCPGPCHVTNDSCVTRSTSPFSPCEDEGGRCVKQNDKSEISNADECSVSPVLKCATGKASGTQFLT